MLKIKKIRNVNQAKLAFNFITKSRNNDAVFNETIFLPLYDLYNSILDNINNPSCLQLCAKLYNTIIGSVISFPLAYEKESLFLQIFAIQKPFRQKGFAKIMLDKIFKLANKYKYKKIVVDYNKISYIFFKNNKFDLCLEVSCAKELEDIIKSKIEPLNLNLINSNTCDCETINKYKIDKPDSKLIKTLQNLSSQIKAKYVFEKTI